MIFPFKERIRHLLTTLNKIEGEGGLFDTLIRELDEYHVKKCHDMVSLKKRDAMKYRGDNWELFCKLYLEVDPKNDTVWLLKEVPKEVRFYLSLSKKDQGIDIVIRRKKRKSRGNDEQLSMSDYYYIPVQCKFRTQSKTGVLRRIKWEELSTYVALCAFTGPWEKHIVMTNSPSIRYPHMERGMKKKEETYRFVIQNLAKTTYQNMDRNMWMKLIKMYQPNIIKSPDKRKTPIKSPTVEKKLKNTKSKQDDDRFAMLWN